MPELLSSLAQLAWPAVVLIGLVLFARPIAHLLRSGSEREDVTIEVGGQRVTLGKFREQQNEATLDLRRQIDDLRRQVGGDPSPTPPGAPAPPRVLWVDDQPENNALFIEQLQGDGVVVDLARSTADGLDLASRRRYGAIITDMGRHEEDGHRPEAGLDLLRRLRAAGDPTPTIVFTSGRTVRARRDAILDAGAQAATSSGVDLIAFLRRHGVVD